MGEDLVTFVVRHGGTLDLPYDMTPKTRWEAYWGLWTRGQLPTRDDLEGLPLSGNGRIYWFFVDLRETIQKAVNDAEQGTDADDRRFEEYLPYADMLEWPESDEWEQLSRVLRRLSDRHFLDLASTMKAWADSGDFDPEEWEYFDEPAHGQDFAFRFFRDGDNSSEYERLGVAVVEGDRPGSNYYAAELVVDVEEANRRAVAADIPIRFIKGEDY